MTAPQILLKTELLRIEALLNHKGEVNFDPVAFPKRYTLSEDQEVVAFISAAFAYGNVTQILNTLEKVFEIIGPTPAQTIRGADGPYWKTKIPQSFKHRFNTADDLGILLTWLGAALRESPTLEHFFSFEGGTLDSALESFITRLTAFSCHPYKKPKSKGALFFTPKPSGKSACKRMLLFLRWMCGQSTMDLKLWNSIPRSQLLIPVDTHILRISQNLGMTKRKDGSWRTAVEITDYLKQLDSEDPTRFDFALCHIGISQACPSRFKENICHSCGMNSFCLKYKKHKITKRGRRHEKNIRTK